MEYEHWIRSLHEILALRNDSLALCATKLHETKRCIGVSSWRRKISRLQRENKQLYDCVQLVYESLTAARRLAKVFCRYIGDAAGLELVIDEFRSHNPPLGNAIVSAAFDQAEKWMPGFIDRTLHLGLSSSSSSS